jgi:hypothetical protein
MFIALRRNLVRSSAGAECVAPTELQVCLFVRVYKHLVPNGTVNALLEKIGCGRRGRTLTFGFKARRAAGYTIPQETDTGTRRIGDAVKEF